MLPSNHKDTIFFIVRYITILSDSNQWNLQSTKSLIREIHLKLNLSLFVLHNIFSTLKLKYFIVLISLISWL